MHVHPNASLAPRGRAKVFEAVEAGMTVSAACLAFGISRRCYYRRLLNHHCHRRWRGRRGKRVGRYDHHNRGRTGLR